MAERYSPHVRSATVCIAISRHVGPSSIAYGFTSTSFGEQEELILPRRGRNRPFTISILQNLIDHLKKRVQLSSRYMYTYDLSQDFKVKILQLSLSFIIYKDPSCRGERSLLVRMRKKILSYVLRPQAKVFTTRFQSSVLISVVIFVITTLIKQHCERHYVARGPFRCR